MEKFQHVVKTVRTNLMELLDNSLNHIKKVKTEYKKSISSLKGIHSKQFLIH